MSSNVIAVRVPASLKKKLSEFDLDVSREVRAYLEQRLRGLELASLIDEVEKEAVKRKVKVDSTAIIRRDRSR
ncbi:MAG: hypothetical protein DRP08_04105 [Candidatus Aenigmatarchaeota archaeon]|nr:MAG: hypothetical protein DRP08_04105 [Candidatus Aenigmarchaeota archaeon]